MSHNSQYFQVDRVIAGTFVVIKVFGLWPYKFNHSGHQIEHSTVSTIYSIFLPIILLWGYVYIGSDLFNESWKVAEVFRSVPLQLIVMAYSYMVIASYLILYVGQHLQYKSKRIAYLLCRKVAKCMREYSTEFVDMQPFIKSFILKTVVYDLFHFGLYYYNLNGVSNTIKSKPYLSIFVYLPLYTIRLNTNVFYGGVLFFNVLFKQLNQSLDKILLGKNAGVISVAELTFEKASLLYLELVQAVKAFNLAFTFQITLWIATQLIMLTTQYFYQYIAIVEFAAESKNEYNRYVAAWQFGILAAIMLSMYEVFTTAFACNSLVKEARLTTVIVHKMNSNVDLKLKNVDLLSIWISLNKLAITDCGMFELDLKTLQAAFATILSYFVILIQFELAFGSEENKSK